MEQDQGGVRTWQWVVTVIVIIVLILLGYYMFSGAKDSAVDIDDIDDTTTTDDSSLIKGNDANRVVVSDQFPGNIVYISSVQLANPGFVVIKSDNAGIPGAVLGSQYFDKGINPGKVTLKSSTVDGSLYYATIYADTDGNKMFDIIKDMPVKDATGNIIMRTFRATSAVTNVK
jgi:hypothetical protein